MLSGAVVFAATNIEGTIVYPETAKADTSVNVVLSQGSAFSFFINKLIGKQALYPGKNSYTLGEDVILQSEFYTWNVKCGAVSAVFEVYNPDGSLLTAVPKSWNSQTATQYINAQATIGANKFSKTGIHNAVVYAICNDAWSVFDVANPEYDSLTYPVISTPDVSKTSFEMMSATSTACVPTNDQDHTKCYNDNIYWYNNCGSLTALNTSCTNGCADDTTCSAQPPTTTTTTGTTEGGYVKLEIMSINVVDSTGSLEVRPADKVKVDVTVRNTGTKDLNLPPASANYYLEIAAYPDEYLIDAKIMNVSESDQFFASIFGFEPTLVSCGGEKWVTSYKIYNLLKGEQKTISVEVVIPSATDKFADGKSAWDFNPSPVTMGDKTKNLFSHQVAGFLFEGCSDGKEDVQSVAGTTCNGPSGDLCDSNTHDAFKGPNSNIAILRTCGEMEGIITCPNATPFCLDPEKAVDADSCCLQCGNQKDFNCAELPGVLECPGESTCLSLVNAKDTDTCCTKCEPETKVCSLPTGAACTPPSGPGLDDSGPSNECASGWCADVTGVGGKCASVGLLGNLKDKYPGAEAHPDCQIEKPGLWDSYVKLFEFAGDSASIVAIALPLLVIVFIVVAGGKKQ